MIEPVPTSHELVFWVLHTHSVPTYNIILFQELTFKVLYWPCIWGWWKRHRCLQRCRRSWGWSWFSLHHPAIWGKLPHPYPGCFTWLFCNLVMSLYVPGIQAGRAPCSMKWHGRHQSSHPWRFGSYFNCILCSNCRHHVNPRMSKASSMICISSSSSMESTLTLPRQQEG